MEGESNIETVKIDINVSGKDKTKSTIQDGEREHLLEVDSEVKSRTDQVNDRNYCVKSEDNPQTAKIDINLSGHAKIKRTVQDGKKECVLEWDNKAESWINQIKSRHKSGSYKHRKSSSGVSIYCVPEFVKKTKREAYEPVVVFLGPYHHKKDQQLTAMDEYKLQAVDKTLERIPGKNIEWLVSELKKLEKEIRDCYEDSAIDWDGDTLSWIMTMDACFILEFLQMDLPNSSLIFQSGRWWNIKRREIISDIMKLENQIPLFILTKILELISNNSGAVPTLLANQLICMSKNFDGHPFLPSTRGEESMPTLPSLIEGGAHHLLDLSRQMIAAFLSNSGSTSVSGSESAKFFSCNFHCACSSCIATPTGVACFRGANWTDVSRWLFQSSSVDESIIPSSEKLKTAGIKLKASTEGKFHFEHKRFGRSKLFVPQISVEDDTEIFLRNLVAFEECQRHAGSPIKRVISTNVWLMDQLINSKEDVQILQRADIIKNYLGSEDEVAKIFNDLGIGVSIGVTAQHDCQNISREVSEHFKGWEESIESIKKFRDYSCPNTWYIVSFVAAGVLFVTSLLQTIYTMESYFHS